MQGGSGGGLQRLLARIFERGTAPEGGGSPDPALVAELSAALRDADARLAAAALEEKRLRAALAALEVERDALAAELRALRGRATPPPLPLPAPDPGEPTQAAPALARARILVVDDEPLVARSIARLLSPPHDVVAVTEAREACRRMEGGEAFDLVLCDLNMPDLSGMQLAARLATTAPDVLGRCVFMTGGAHTDDAREFLERGEHAVLEKPIDAQALRELAARSAGRAARKP
jgi:CheY-like chemotaxis protein